MVPPCLFNSIFIVFLTSLMKMEKMAMLLLSIHEATALIDGRPSYSVTGAGTCE